ncbi:hypothetical protein QL285_050434 [Trifolium repens]|nr:hypothetical protein QL285_050434 [Trifolium repens]
MGGSYGVPQSRIPHGRGGFFFSLRLPRGGDGRFLPILVEIVVVGGGYSLLCAVVLAGSFKEVVDIWGEGAIHEACRLCFAFPPSYTFESKELYNWAIYEFGPMS